MAIGGNFNNSNGNSSSERKLWETQYFSRFKIRNTAEKKQISVSFRSGLLILSLDQLGDNFTATTLQQIYLSPTKALLLAHELELFLDYLNKGTLEDGKGFGVNAGMNEKVTYIAFHAGNGERYITIGKIDNAGNILEKETMTVVKDYHYALEWTDVDAMKVERNVYDDIDFEMLRSLLLDFAHSMNGADAYSFADLTRYDARKVLNKLDQMGG